MKLKNIYIVVFLANICACQKTSVYFKDNTISEDPNITYWDNYAVTLSTYKLDTFSTSNDSVWLLGTYDDPEFGKISSNSISEINRPQDHPFKDPNNLFDSALVLLVPNGNYYGDTTKPFYLKVYELAENLGTDTASSPTYYNNSKTSHKQEIIGSLNTRVNPLRGDTMFIKLSNSFSNSLYHLMKNDTEVMTNQASFRSFLKGIFIETDSTRNKAFYQFKASGGASIIRIYYTQKGLYNEKKYFDVTYVPTKQYNQINFNYAGSTFKPFSPGKSELIESTKMDNKALLNNYIPSLVKIQFPDILNVTQTHPFVKVMKAELEIRVNKSLNNYPYVLPDKLLLYISNQNNDLSSVATSSATSYPLTGDLVINDLVQNGTKYTYNITSYINTIINEGRFSTKSLFLSPYYSTYNSATSRLILSNNASDPDVRLKLYVLGL